MSVNEPNSTWAIRTLGGIPIKVVSRSGSYEAEAASMTEEYIIRADQLEEFVLETFPITDASGVPARIRAAFGLPTAVTQRISWEALTPGLPCDPFASDSGAPAGTYDENLKLTIEYSTSVENTEDPDPARPETFLEISANASGEFLNAPIRGTAKWDPSGDEVKDINVPQTVIQPEVEWSVRWSRMPWQYFNGTVIGKLRGLLGKVNDSAMAIFHDAPAETILFLGFNVRQQFTWRSGVAGRPPLTIEFKFLEKNFVSEFDQGGKVSQTQVTHNHFLRPGQGYQVLLKDGTNKVYAQDDLSQIFNTS